jgi:hypothetical protein
MWFGRSATLLDLQRGNGESASRANMEYSLTCGFRSSFIKKPKREVFSGHQASWCCLGVDWTGCRKCTRPDGRIPSVNIQTQSAFFGFEMPIWHLKHRLIEKSQVANTWTKITARRVYRTGRNGKEGENFSFSSVAATFEKAITYVFAGSPIRNAEARSSTLLCSTNNPTIFKYLQLQPISRSFFLVTPF